MQYICRCSRIIPHIARDLTGLSFANWSECGETGSNQNEACMWNKQKWIARRNKTIRIEVVDRRWEMPSVARGQKEEWYRTKRSDIQTALRWFR